MKETKFARVVAESGGAAEVARELGVTPQAVRNWTSGRRQPRAASLIRLLGRAEALGVRITLRDMLGNPVDGKGTK